MGLTLGLDLGTNSIGWALVRKGDPIQTDALEGALEGLGVRIFEPSVEDGWEHTPKNKGRRDARGARRTIQRAANRRKQLRKQLVGARLLPDLTDARQPEKALDEIGDPYDLRGRALVERLEPHQIGRVLLHLCVRRGFLSNRKERWGSLLDCDEDGVKSLILEIEEDEAKEGRGRKANQGRSAAGRKAGEDEREVLEGIQTLCSDMKTAGARTLGEYLAGLPEGERKRARYTDRQMYEDEFEKVWEAQAKHHPALLTDELKERVRHAIFRQRPPNLKRGRGHCSLEPQLPRAAMARLESQRFRLLQDVNNLEVAGVFRDEYPIGPEQRRKLADALERSSFERWAAVRRTLFGGHGTKVKMNMEVAGSKGEGLTGNRTASALHGVIPIQWDAYDEEKRKRLVNDLITITDKRELFTCLRRKWRFEPKTALLLAGAGLESGYANLSLKAINALLPYMERGRRYDEARQDVARASSSDSVKGRYGYEASAAGDAEFLGRPPDYLRNPAVEKALHELRKVVNAVIRTHGKPDVIRVELTRDLKRSKEDRKRIEDQQAKNRQRNKEARDAYFGLRGKEPSRNDLIKHRLWREQGQECAYTVGKCISMSELFSEEVEIDHIIPYSLHPDDSYMNKVVCLKAKNQEKRKQTPWQAFGTTPDWEEMTQRVKRWEKANDKRFRFPSAKAARFVRKDAPDLDGFLNRQLPDTGYISREAKKYLERLGVDVEVTRGGATSRLRSLWELNDALGGPPGEKNRSDHRHHALDAAVIAVTDRSVYRGLTEMARLNVEDGRHPFTRGRTKLDMPWPGFGQAVKDGLANVVISHAPLRKLSGSLHKGKAYGRRFVPGESGEKFVRRWSLKDLSDAMFTERKTDEQGKKKGGRPAPKIVDPVLREAMQKEVRGRGSVKAAFPEGTFPHPANPGGPLVRRVRVYENLSESTLSPMDKQRTRNDAPFQHYAYGNNHHVEIFRNAQTGKVEPRFVTMMEAAARARRHKTSIVEREWEGREFLMSLAINDMVELAINDMVEVGKGGPENLYRVQALDAANRNIILRRHKAATLIDDLDRLIASPNVLIEKRNARKVNVSPIGELREARD